jgi:ParB-like chromosome segregation protein Spo0J
MSERQVAAESLSLDLLSPLRLTSPEAQRRMEQSLMQHGQMTSVLVYLASSEQLEVVDGLKRVRAARELGLALRVRTLPVDRVQAKVAIAIANATTGLDEIEEAWLIRSLYRDDALSQPQIAQVFSRHKSWVSRRLMLAEHLDGAVEIDLRLGLINASCARELARLPRGNQQGAAQVVMRRGLTSRQTAQLVQATLEAPHEARAQLLERALASNHPPPPGRLRARSSLPLEAISTDVAALMRIAARLQARLLERPLASFGQEAAVLLVSTLRSLGSVVDALSRTIARVVTEASPK